MIPLLLFLINIAQKQINEQPIIFDGISDIYASEFIFISTHYGIYTFDRNSENWSRITQANGLPDNKIDIIGLDEGILWVATPNGLASADVRINDWQTYDLPGIIQGLVFDDEYVWVGGDFGLKRFDKYVETWEDIAAIKINHMFSEKNYIWLATDSGVLRYNREFEKIEQVPAAPKYPFSYIINTPKIIWFLSQNQFVAYRKISEYWSTHNSLEINSYSNMGDSLFIASKGKVYLYKPEADNWVLFRDIEGLQNVNGIYISGREILFATDNGLLIYNYIERSRKFYNRSAGLETDSLISAYQETKYIFVINQNSIEYLNKDTNIWQIEELKPPGKKRKKIFYIDEAGGHARFVKDVDIKLQGRAYYSESRTISDSTTTRSDYENINLKLIGQHSSNRLLSMYYDDTDKDQIMYGFGYRGLTNDFLYRCNAGFLESEYYEFDLIPQFSTFGSNAKLRYKAHSMELQGGQLKSTLRNDFFTGKSIEKEISLFDISYSKNIFYHIYSVPQMITKGTDTIFLDDQNSATNTFDTRIDFTVAGITGNFDPLINGIDYYIDYTKGIIHFLNQRNDSDIIVLLINGEEIVIQSDLITGNVLENIYFIGPDIIPNSLSLVITDTLGQIYSLNDFGLDNNGDSQVDAEFINHDLGFLSFPQARPFPDQVYDDTLHIFTMDIQFASQSVFYYLSFKPIRKMSEKVYVDGELMTRGPDYIVDYTSGILLFLNEDIISGFSEIEVQYSSVERDREDMFYSAQPNISIGEHINIAPGFSVVDEEKIAHVSAKMQAGSSNEKSIKFIPQAAISDQKAWAHNYSLIANYKILSINTEYCGFSDDFESFGANEKKYGKLQHGATASASIEPFSYVRLDGQFKREYQIDSLNEQKIAQYSQGKINYLNQGFINGYIFLGKDDLPDYEKKRIRVSAKYNFQILKSSIKLNSIVRNINVKYSENNKSRIIEYVINANFSLSFPLQGNIYFRNNNSYDNDLKQKNEQEIRGTLNIDVIPGIYYTGNYNLKATSFYLDILQDITLQNYFYNNLNIAPGRWYSRLSLINFSLGMGNNFEEYIRNLPATYKKPYVIFNPLDNGTLSSINNMDNYYITVQFTPFSNILIWGKHSLSKIGIAYYEMPDLKPILKDEIRIEYEPGNLGFFITSWEHRTTETYPLYTVQNVYFEWSKPWTALLRTKLTTNYRLNQYDYTSISINDSEIRTTFETLVRFDSKSFIILNLGGARKKNSLNEIDYSIMPGAGLNLNLIRCLYLQFDYESTFILDGLATHIVSAKITGQF